MFSDCTSLITGSKFPSTKPKINYNISYRMFAGCSSLSDEYKNYLI